MTEKEMLNEAAYMLAKHTANMDEEAKLLRKLAKELPALRRKARLYDERQYDESNGADVDISRPDLPR